MSNRDKFTEEYKRFREQVERDNEVFAAATPAQKRVIIAKDALAHLAGGRIHPRTGGYGSSHVGRASKDLRENMVEDSFVCSGCARGGLFYSAVMRRNGVAGRYFQGNNSIDEFPDTMMAQIEAVFEGSSAYMSHLDVLNPIRWRDPLEVWQIVTTAITHRVSGWTKHKDFRRFKTASEYRFHRILHWIIDRDGDFNLAEFLPAELERLPETARTLARQQMANYR